MTPKLKPKPEVKKELMVTHGGVTHPIDEPCEFCEKVKREYEKELKPMTLKQESKGKRKEKFIFKIRMKGRDIQIADVISYPASLLEADKIYEVIVREKIK